MMLAAQLARMTGRLRTAVTGTGDAMQRVMHGISNDLRKIADNLVTADGTGARSVSRVDPDMPRLFGQSARSGLVHAFTPDQVRSLPILGPDKKVVGVHFPSQLKDVKKPLIFTRDGHESARHQYHQYTRGPGLLQRLRPKWSYVGPSSAPWGEETVYARAHATKNGYDVQVKKKIPFTKWSRWVRMRVDGETYGTILAADKHFKQAARGAPTAELIQMSCSPATGAAARESAASLHSVGIGFDVYVTEKAHLYLQNPSKEPGLVKQYGDTILGHGSEIERNQPGDLTKSPWTKYKAPIPRPNVQD